MTSSGKCFLKAQRGCVPAIAEIVPCAAAGLGNVQESPGGIGFEVMKGSCRAAEVRDCERPWKAIGEGAAPVVIITAHD